jgi:AraC-like DNA-binding protein
MERGTNRGISAGIVKLVARALGELGAPPTKLDAVETGYVPGPVADALVDNAAVALADPALGIALARHLPAGSLGPLDYAMLTAGTWGEALRRSAQFYAVVSDRVEMTLEELGDEAHVVQRLVPGVPQSRHWVEMLFAVITERGRQAVGPEFRLRSIAFAHAAPPADCGHARYFDAPVHFGEPVDRLVFDRSFLAAPLLAGAAGLAAALERQLAELVPTALDPSMVRVRAAVSAGIDDGSATLDATAERLQMAPRTLQRMLQDHDTSFKQLLDDMRRDRALALLHDGKLTVAEIAAKVGFAEATGFFRAFRRWTGTTPGSQRPAEADDELEA